jgi:outer membrane protein
MKLLGIALTAAVCMVGGATADRALALPAGGVVPTTDRPVAADLQAGALRLTLADAVARGLQASHRLAEFRARESSAQAVLDAREVADRPLLSLQAGYVRTNHVDEFGIQMPNGLVRIIYPDVPDNYRTRVDMQWPIYTFGRTEALERIATAELTATGKDLEAARNDLRLDITRAFWALVTAEEAERVVEQSLKRMDASLADVRNRLKVGLVPPNDVLSAEAQRSRQQMLLIQARNLRDLAAADLRRLVGLAPDTPLELDATLDEAMSPIAAGDALVAEARQGRPERQALAARTGATVDRRLAAEASKKPTIALAAGFDYARPNVRIFPRMAEWKPSWDVGVSINWLFWDAGRRRADIAEATAGERAAEERLAEFDTQLELEVRQRRLDLASAQAAIAAAADAVRSAAEARRVVTERFAAGVATSTDVLDAQVAQLQAELDRTQVLAAARLAAARLERAVGR